MKKGLTTLGVAALALLSGSVFAAGPTIDQIPTVIVTDRTTDPNDFDGISVTSGPTSNLFRFTDALDLTAYVNDTDTPVTSLKYLFSERDTPGATTESSPSTIAIDGLTGSPYATTQGTVDSTGSNISANPLDFRNVKYSPGTGAGPFPAPAGGALPESRTIRLYVSDASAAAMATGDFTVITTNATGSYDATSAVTTNVFIGPEVPINTFDNWNSTQITTFADNSQPGAPNPTTPENIGLTTVSPLGTLGLNLSTLITRTLSPGSTDPALTASLAGTGSTGLAVFWASGNTQAQAVTAGDLYRIRWTLTSTDASNANHSTLRVRQGNVNSIGSSEDVINPPNGPTSAGSFSYNTWFAPKASGNMPFAFDVYDFSPTTTINASLDSVSINHTTRALLASAGTATVVQNVGNPTFSTFAGEPTPDASAVSNFPAASSSFNFASLVGTNRAVTITPAATSVTFTIASTSDNTFTNYAFGGVAAGTGFVSADPSTNTLFVADLWATAPSGSGDNLPTFRFGFNAAASAGGSSLAYFSGAATQNQNGGTANAQALQSTSRMYTGVFQPQLGSGTVDYRFDTNILVFDNTAGFVAPVRVSGTVRFDRITITRYSNLPSLN